MSGRPIRVLQLVRIMNRAGVETWLMHLLRHFDRREIAMDFLVQTSTPGAYDEEIRSRGAQIIACHPPRQPVRYGLDFQNALRRYGPYDVVHSHNYFGSGLDLPLAAHGEVEKRIAHIHPASDIAAERPLRWFYRRTMARSIRRYATCMLAPSHASLEAIGAYGDFSGLPSGVVRNCVDLSAYRAPLDRAAARRALGLPADRPVVVYVARFVPHKNHGLLLQVADRLNGMGVPAHFAAAGTDGESRAAFQRACAARRDFSVLVDPPDIAPLLACADLFLFPSLEEGFGAVAIEAAAAGLPVVATSLPAIREACAPSHREFMFAPNDGQAAAAAVRTILRDAALAQRLASDARNWADDFSIGAVAEQLAEIYRTGAPAPVGREETAVQ